MITFQKFKEFVIWLTFIFTTILSGFIICIKMLNGLPPETKHQVAVELGHQVVYSGFVFIYFGMYTLFFAVIIGPIIIKLIKDLMGVKNG